MNGSMLRLMTAVMLCTVAAAPAVDVTVDVTKKFQTIDGFGSWGMKEPPWNADVKDTVPALWDDQFVDMVMNDLGMTIIRDELPSWEFEKVNDNSDPYITDFSKFNITGTDRTAKQFAWLRRITRAGINKVLTCVWSPPDWMKDGNGHLSSPAMMVEFAEMCWAYVTICKEKFGVTVDAVGVQNEPELATSYASCLTTEPEMADRVAAVKAYFKQKGCTTKVLAPEKIFEGNSIGALGLTNYLTAIYAKPDGVNNLDIIGIHYPGGESMLYDYHVADPGWLYPNHQYTWVDTGWGWTKYKKPFWVTEGGGFGDTWNGAMTFAKALHNGFKYGHLTAWVWWALGDPADATDRQYALTWGGVPGFCYYVAKHWYRYVRPGAVMVDCQSTDVGNVGAVAFDHPQLGYTTIELVNASGSSQAVTIKGNGLPVDFDAFQSTATQKCVKLPNKVMRTITLPAGSMTTLCSKVPAIGTGTAVRQAPSLTGAHARASAGRAGLRAYALDGSCVGTVAGGASLSTPSARGVYLVMAHAADGRVARMVTADCKTR